MFYLLRPYLSIVQLVWRAVTDHVRRCRQRRRCGATARGDVDASHCTGCCRCSCCCVRACLRNNNSHSNKRSDGHAPRAFFFFFLFFILLLIAGVQRFTIPPPSPPLPGPSGPMASDVLPSTMPTDAEELFLLGFVHFDSLDRKKRQLAPVLFDKAAEQSHPKALRFLAQCFYDGIGVPKSIAEAMKLWQRAGELVGFVNACADRCADAAAVR